MYEDARTAKVGRRLARRTAWRSVAEVTGGAWTDLPRTAEIAAVQVRQRNQDTPELPPPTRPMLEPAAIPDPVAQPTQHPQPEVAPSYPRRAAAEDPFLRERVYAFLDQHDGLDMGLDEADEPYLAWSVAEALGVSPDAVAPHVRSWRWSLDSGPVPVS